VLSRNNVTAAEANLKSAWPADNAVQARRPLSARCHFRITDIYLETATARRTGRDRANQVEQCSCPEGYTGLSCEVSWSCAEDLGTAELVVSCLSFCRNVRQATTASEEITLADARSVSATATATNAKSRQGHAW